MNVQEISIEKLFVSELNVRKTLESEEDETGVSDLSNDIRTNGLINPLTVRKFDNKYEIIAGQRRFLACKMLNKLTIPCSIIDVSSQKAEELSLVENVQRNQMTNYDKIKTYTKLFSVYNKDINKVVNAVHISRNTLMKYIKLDALPDEIMKLLDSNTEEKITLDVAVELTKLPMDTNKMDIVKNISTLTTAQKILAIKEFIRNGHTDAGEIHDIKGDIAIQQNNIALRPSFPYVLDADGNCVRIPEQLYPDIIALIQEKVGVVEKVY
jgi:ParB family chromosome partitioning protein